MSREIKFRAWNEDHYVSMNDNDEGYVWIFDADGFRIEYYDADQCKISGGELCPFEGWVKCPNVIFEQFTGLYDCKRTPEYPKGQEIYEGDICNIENSVETISWNQEFCRWDTEQRDGLEEAWDIEVIGNIHENPELLKL